MTGVRPPPEMGNLTVAKPQSDKEKLQRPPTLKIRTYLETLLQLKNTVSSKLGDHAFIMGRIADFVLRSLIASISIAHNCGEVLSAISTLPAVFVKYRKHRLRSRSKRRRRALTLPLENSRQSWIVSKRPRTCDQTQSPFFSKLPVEIRSMIWSLLLSTDMRIEDYNPYDPKPLIREPNWWACVRTCRRR
jgi:hypothetical protein